MVTCLVLKINTERFSSVKQHKLPESHSFFPLITPHQLQKTGKLEEP